jgi:predicted DNA-binding transcriptional regulator YafY
MKPTGHSLLFWLLHRAILERKQVVFGYQGYPREICPVILGHKESRERLLAYQFAGSGSRGPVRGEWKCFDLDQIKDAKTRAGRWHSGDTHRAPQSCIDDVFIDVNTKVLDQPGRRPELLKSLKPKRARPKTRTPAKTVKRTRRRGK